MRAAVTRAFIWLLTGLMGLSVAAGEKDEAKARFQEGVALFSKEDYPGALAAFEESYRLAPKPTVLYNVGMCEKALYRYTDSTATFRKYLAEGGDKIKADRRKEVEAAMAEMAGLMGRLRLEDAPDGAEVRVNGIAAGMTPLAQQVALDPGRHALEVSKPGFEPLRIEITVISGAEVPVRAALSPVKTVVIEPVAPPIAPPALVVLPAPKPVAVKAPPSPPQGRSEKKEEGVSGFLIGGVACTAVGIAGLGVGGFFTYKSDQDFKDGADAANTGDRTTYAEVRDDRLPADRVGMIAGYVTGGALLVTGVVLLVADWQGSGGKTATPVAATPGGLTIVW
ncbi:MAG: PEGA domain-containing protein [Deltaproteobacteria bacterium]|nr:PEGA domain-containing protein [Deltaproteobacteria bacterium]